MFINFTQKPKATMTEIGAHIIKSVTTDKKCYCFFDKKLETINDLSLSKLYNLSRIFLL